MMTEKEKAAYILGLKNAIEQIEEEVVLIEMEYWGRPEFLKSAQDALQNAVVSIQDEIAMTDGTRETKEK